MNDEAPKKKPRRNLDVRRAQRTAEIATFVQQYARRAQKGWDPNDRHYDRDVERRVSRMDPLELDRLMREDEDAD